MDKLLKGLKLKRGAETCPVTSSNKTATTFRVSSKEPEKHPDFKGENIGAESSHQDEIQNLPHYQRNNCEELLQTSNFPIGAVISDNGFVKTVVDCYNRHHNLVVRPDDVWSAIMTQFSFYINKHSEEFRGKFVDFDGKRELQVTIDGSLRFANYDTFVKLMSKEIDRNLVDPEVKKWILPSFSTTTENDLITVGVIFMASMKKYFEYKCRLCCGIPYLTLEGTVKDWKEILRRLDKLKEYKLERWHAMLEPILKEFVYARDGKADKDFWNRICHYQWNDSGSDNVSGWITAFCVFDKDGNWQDEDIPLPLIPLRHSSIKIKKSTVDLLIIEADSIPTGIVEVDVKIIDNGTLHNSIMFAGHMGAEIKGDGCTVQPTLGWAIALKRNNSEIPKTDDQL